MEEFLLNGVGRIRWQGDSGFFGCGTGYTHPVTSSLNVREAISFRPDLTLDKLANSQSTQHGSLSWDGKDIALTYDKGGIYLGENNNSNNRISINDTGNITLRAAKGIYIRPAVNDNCLYIRTRWKR